MTRRGQYGHIVNISSMSGHRVPNGASGGSFYAATKHALRALTEGLRQEVLPQPWALCHACLQAARRP
jgi:NAD(P)-dependent dehydrogenase (short-subunit alcohol dehydrogenase family)